MATGNIDVSHSGDSAQTGTLVPDRIFIGGISDATTEQDLITTFSRFGRIKEAKVIVNKSGVSRGYGFVTFETEEDAKRVLVKFQSEGLVLKERRLNIAQAVRKKQSKDSNDITNGPSDTFPWSSQSYLGSPGVAPDIFYPRGTWALGWAPTYVQQTYPVQVPNMPQIYPLAPADYMQSMAQFSCSSYVEACNTNEALQNMKIPMFDGNTQFAYAHTSDQVPDVPGNSSNIENPMHYMYPSQTHLNQPVFNKTLNGLTVLTYPGPYELPNPALIQAKENEHGNPIVDYGYMHCVGIPDALSPPITPYNSSLSLDCFKK